MFSAKRVSKLHALTVPTYFIDGFVLNSHGTLLSCYVKDGYFPSLVLYLCTSLQKKIEFINL